MKRYILICLSLVLIACAFVGCSNENTMFSNPTTTESSTVSSSDTEIVYYDKKGNEYSSMRDIIFYDKHDNEYVYEKDGDTACYQRSDGKKCDYEKCFINTDGTFIYDEDDSLTMSENYMSATDSDGNVYYPAATVYWNDDGEIVPYFGMGELILNSQDSE
jgi:hypothetical protein